MMNELDWWYWLAALAHGAPVPGEYVSGTNPLDVMTGE